LAAPLAVVALIVGGYGWSQVAPKPAPVDNRPQTLGQSSAAATPRPTVGRTFGDLLKERPSFTGWLAGVDNGSIYLVQPENGSINKIVTAANSWYGPISDMVWSPDRSKLAYLTLPLSDAASLTADAKAFARQSGFTDIPTPASFPFGQVTILDLISQQSFQTTVEVRNTPKSIVWLDSMSLAAVGQTVIKYSLVDNKVSNLVAGGNTTGGEQLQSPLAWDAATETLYFTKVKQQSDGQTVRLLVSLHQKTNQLTEMQPLRTGPFDKVTTSQGIDLALSADGRRLAQIGDQGLSYITLNDGAVHLLPYRDDRIWMQRSTLADLQWLSPDKVAFSSLATDGSKVWAVWYIPTNDIGTLGKNSLAASWDTTTDRLAMVQPDGQSIGIMTPNWSDMAKSQLQTLPLPWDQLSW
jgi:hypothetical protein